MRLYTSTEFAQIECCNCHVIFAMTDEMDQHYHTTKKLFYCPNGHGQHYTGVDREQQLKDRIKGMEARNSALRDQLDATERSKSALKGVVTRKKNELESVKSGKCPCCNKYFKVLHKHMENRHPTYDPQSDAKS